MINEDVLVGRDIHKPTSCEKCGGLMLYTGIGEYVCEKCRHVMYDDYGKVRNYIEKHRGATQGEVASATGVSSNTIRQLLRDDRIEVTPNSAVFLSCEICGSPIRSGRYCDKCLTKNQTQKASDRKSSNSIRGFGLTKSESQGAKRFSR